MLRYPIFKQDNEYSCGAYCIKMILKYYHLDISIKEIKQLSKITSAGISVYGMVKCLAAFSITILPTSELPVKKIKSNL